MMKLKIFNICLKSAAWSGLFVLFVLLASLAALLIRLWFAPLDVTRMVELVKPHVNTAGWEVTHGQVSLSWQGRMELTVRDLTARKGENEAITARQLNLTFTNRYLIRGKFVAKHVSLSGLRGTLVRDENSLRFAGHSIPLGAKAQSETTQFAPLAFVNSLNPPSWWRGLRTIQLNDVQVVLQDEAVDTTWLFRDLHMRFSKYSQIGERLVITARALPGEETSGVALWMTLIHPPQADEAQLNIRLVDAETGVLRPYLPPALTNILSARGELELQVPIGIGQRLGALRFRADLTDIELYPDMAFTAPLVFNSLQLEGRYDHHLDDATLWVDRLEIVDPNQAEIFIAGDISNLGSVPQVDVLLTSSDGNLQQLYHYIPDQYLGETRGWLLERTKGGKLSNLSIRFTGGEANIEEGCAKTCGLSIDLDFHDADIQFLEELPAATGLNGHFKLSKDQFFVYANSAQLSKQVSDAVTVTVGGLYRDTYGDLTVEAHMNGPLQDGLELLYAELGEVLFPPATGKHNTHFVWKSPLGVEIEPNNMDLTADSTIYDGRMPVPGLETIKLHLPKGKLNIGDGAVKLTGKGSLNDIPVQLKLTDSIATLGETPKIDLSGRVDLGQISPQLQQLQIAASGTVPFAFNLAVQPGDMYDFKLNSTLTPAAISWPLASWHKAADSALELSLVGTHSDSTGTKLNKLSADGEGVAIKGVANWTVKPATRSISLTKIQAGEHDFKLSLNKQKLKISGAKLDLGGILEMQQSNQKADLTWLKGADISLQKLTLPGGDLTGVNFVSNSMNDKLTQLNGSALLPSGALLQTQMAVSQTVRTITLTTPAGGEFIRVAGLSEKFENGALTLQADLPADTFYPVHGSFNLSDFNLRKQPLLTELLASLSLQQLFSSEKGILFDKLHVPFLINENKVRVYDTIMDGPSLGIKLQGDYDRATKTLDMKGQVAPEAGVNRIISKIPVVGNVLTGSQDALITADFSVKGSPKDPRLSVNPFSILTPGLVKDVFKVMEEGGEDAPVLPTPAEED